MSLRYAVGGAVAVVAMIATPAMAGEGQDSKADARGDEIAEATSGAPLAVLAKANAEAADASETPEALAAPAVMRTRARLQCVPYARDASGLSLRGNANTWWRQAAGRYERAEAPKDGAVIVMRGYNNPGRGHVAVVREVLSERSILIDHANWLNSGEVTLNVPVVDVSPNNDWSQVRVWHIPSQAWGVRVYGVQGFILPPAEPSAPGGAVTHIAR
jgi:surface antigen